jgi:hypothetical protein
MDCLEIKLSQAKLIKRAHTLGIPGNSLSLGSFDFQGGSHYLVKELIQIISKSTKDCETDIFLKRKNEVELFSQEAEINFDDAIAEYVQELCDSNANKADFLGEAMGLVRLCCSPAVKCTIALKILRAALLCKEKPTNLANLSEEAIGWATDEQTKSELEEATRLLAIDKIVRKYCGDGAAELFNVSDSRHALRLLSHVCRHIDEKHVLIDALLLCDAFTHLSRGDACISILERVALSQDLLSCSPFKSRIHQCEAFMERLYEIEVKLADSVGIRVCMFCADIIGDLCRKNEEHSTLKKDFETACSSACSVLSIMVQHSHTSALQSQSIFLSNMGAESSLELFRQFQRIRDLCVEFGILVDLSELKSGQKRIEILESELINLIGLETQSNLIKKDLDLKSALSRGKRCCTLLFGDNTTETIPAWCDVVGSISCRIVEQNRNEDACLHFLEASGLLNEMFGDSAYRAIITLVMSLYDKARTSSDDNYTDGLEQDFSLDSLRPIIFAGSLLEEHVIMFCPNSLLPSITFLNNLTDIMTEVILRADCGAGESMELYRKSLHERCRSRREPLVNSKSKGMNRSNISLPKLHPTWYVGDGLLLNPKELLSHCMQYCEELLQITSSERKSTETLNIHLFLDSRGAYSISLRVLACTSIASLNSGCVASKWIFQELASISHDTFIRLAERSLGGSGNGITNAQIDSQLAVANLLSLPLKTAFKVRHMGDLLLF